jgi:predicted RNase H-like HicB family nuclease
MEKIKIQIVWNKNYGAALDLLPGCVAVDRSLSGVKEGIRSAIALHLETMREDGDVIPSLFNGAYELVFELDSRALIHQFEGTITRTGLSKWTGINEKQLGHYAQGVRNPRPAQREKIVDGFHRMAKELLEVE